MAEEALSRERVLAELRCAHLRAQCAVKEIELIGSALRDDVITTVEAVEALDRLGWNGFTLADVMAKIRRACGADVG